MPVFRTISRPFVALARMLGRLGLRVARITAIAVVVAAVFVILDAALLRDTHRN